MVPYRRHHLLNMLTEYEEETPPLPSWVNFYFKRHKALGAKDRKWIAETAYALVRWQGLWDFLGAKGWEGRLIFHESDTPESFSTRQDLPPHIRCSFPEDLFKRFVSDYGEEKALELAFASNQPAPLTIRVNSLKGGREELAEKWSKKVETSPCTLSDVGLRIEGRPQLLTLPEYKAGWFELQDEASQLIANLVEAKPGEEGLDYCAGSGGKTLALAAKMENKGQIFLHDVRPKMLYKALKRMKRAGVQNAQCLEGPLPKRLKGRMDWVLVDAPCSGTGTFRRQPDAKWRLDSKSFATLQREIVAKAEKALKPGGRLIYATCSILNEENGEQLAYFEDKLGLKKANEPFQSVPKDGEMDGFYGVVLTKC